MKRKPIEHMNPGERAVLRRAFADYMNVVGIMVHGEVWPTPIEEALEDALTRITSLLGIPQRSDGTYDFAQYETPREGK